MEKQTSCITEETVMREQSPEMIAALSAALARTGISSTIPAEYDIKGYLSNIIRGVLELLHVEAGRISCLLRVKPLVANKYGSLHGGVVASVAELIAVACAKTVGGNEKDLFLGELSNAYLSSAPSNAEVIVEASILRTGRNLTVVSVEFRMKESNKLNKYGALHGGVVASVAELVAEACARTVMGNRKHLFLGELSNSYLSSARRNTEVRVEASIVTRGRNLTVVSVEFRMKESDKLVYTSRANFYHMPVASLRTFRNSG